ncbi:Rap1a/Tai family immunity protein [Pseudomonas veronii]
MKAWTIGAGLLIAAVSGNVLAMDGNGLLKACQSAVRFSDTRVMDDEFSSGYCFGVLQTVGEMMVVVNPILKSEKQVCAPKGMTNEQAARITVKYLKENPSKLHQDGSSLVVFALLDSYPCMPQK